MSLKKLDSYAKVISEIPVACAILDANKLRLDTANSAVLELWAKDSSIINLPLLDFLPELASQPYPNLLKQVIKQNIVLKDSAARVEIERFGKPETIFMDYSYTPIHVTKSRPTAVLVTATDVTQRERDKLSNIENLRTLQALVNTSPAPMCLFLGSELEVDTVNDHMLKVWKHHKHIGIKAMKYVYHQGVPFSVKIDEMTYSYTPIRDGLGNSRGVIMVTG